MVYIIVSLTYVNYTLVSIQCRLIVSQMSGKNVEVFNYLFIPVVMAMLVSFLRPQYELGILYGLLVTVLMAHVHFGCSIVSEKQ